MTLATHSERETFVANLIRNCPKAGIRHSTRLMRLAHTYHFFQDLRTRDGYLLPHATRKESRVIQKIADLARAVDCVPIFQSPRPDVEHTVGLHLPEGKGELWIPTS